MRRIWWIGAVALAVVTIGLALVQSASLALFGPLGHDPSAARAFGSTWPFDAAAATGIDRWPPAAVELARAALIRDEPDRAAALLAGLPAGASVDDLRGQVAAADGRFADAIASFGASGDVVRADATIDGVAERDPLAAYALAASFARDVVRRDAPAPVRGDAAWRAGQRAAAVAADRPAEAARYDAIALAFYRDAVRDDPTQEAYLLAAGFGALATGDAVASREAYRRAVAVVPNSVDGYVGLAVSEARLGDCAASRADLTRAQAFAERQQRVVDPMRAGYDAISRAALQRCRERILSLNITIVKQRTLVYARLVPLPPF
jgi:tetratricopeptide (TPR) repeat protein